MLNERDFIQVEYTGRLKESGAVFDTTSKIEAEKAGIVDEGALYAPAVVSVGAGQLLAGLDKALVGKEAGKEYKIELSAENAFGKKDARRLKLIATSKFTKQGIQAHPGLRVNIDGDSGTIKTVTGGRTIVDFNHPLSGQSVVYDVNVLKVVSEPKEKLLGLLRTELIQKQPKIEITGAEAEITLDLDIPEEFIERFKNKALNLISDLKTMKFNHPTNLNTRGE